MKSSDFLADIDLDLAGRFSGKVRETWPIENNQMIIITTDRLSAFDRNIGLVEYKGQVLNQMSAWWFKQTSGIVRNHLIDVPDPNVSVVERAQPLPIEVVMRSRLTGSTSTSMLPLYLKGERSLYGYKLPDDLKPHDVLPEIMLTPTTKAQNGLHDEPIDVNSVVDEGLIEESLWKEIKDISYELFKFGMERAQECGFILADTKYEFATMPDGSLILIDEIHTPDSSRYWKMDTLEDRLNKGLEPENYDKEPVRLALKESGYTGDGQVPKLSEEVWKSASSRYVKIYETITGQEFVAGEKPISDRIKKTLKGKGLIP